MFRKLILTAGVVPAVLFPIPVFAGHGHGHGGHGHHGGQGHHGHHWGGWGGPNFSINIGPRYPYYCYGYPYRRYGYYSYHRYDYYY
jgi:hypothetical protein